VVPNGGRVAHFIDPMLLLRTDRLPEGTGWQYEVKLDGYRAQAIKTGGRVQLRSRNAKDFTTRTVAWWPRLPACRTKRWSTDRLPPKPPRSKLEPYAELIQELRRRGRSYREIAGILTDCCGVSAGAHTVYNFVRTRTSKGTEPVGRNGWQLDLSQLRARLLEKPRTKAGQVRQMWPDMRRGPSLRLRLPPKPVRAPHKRNTDMPTNAYPRPRPRSPGERFGAPGQPTGLVFPSDAGTPIEMNNFSKRVFQPLLTVAGLRKIRLVGLRTRSDGPQFHPGDGGYIRTPDSWLEYFLRGQAGRADLSATIRNTAATRPAFRFSRISASAEE